MRTLLIIALLVAVETVHTAAAQDAAGPTPLPDATNEAAWPGRGPIRAFPWMTDNRAYFWTRRSQDQGAVVFVGDSLTGNWNGEAHAAAFPKLKVANRGIGGDVSRGVLFRLPEDVLSLHPEVIVLCIGSNDLSAHADPADIAVNIAAIIDQAHAADPKTAVVLCTLAPRDSAEAPTKPGALDDANARIRQLASSRPQVTLFDLHAALLGPDGKQLLANFAADRLHLSDAGYAVWAAALRPVLEKLATK